MGLARDGAVLLAGVWLCPSSVGPSASGGRFTKPSLHPGDCQLHRPERRIRGRRGQDNRVVHATAVDEPQRRRSPSGEPEASGPARRRERPNTDNLFCANKRRVLGLPARARSSISARGASSGPSARIAATSARAADASSNLSIAAEAHTESRRLDEPGTSWLLAAAPAES